MNKIDEAWSMFEKTGSIENYMIYKSICKNQKEINSNVIVDGRNSNQISQRGGNQQTPNSLDSG